MSQTNLSHESWQMQIKWNTCNCGSDYDCDYIYIEYTLSLSNTLGLVLKWQHHNCFIYFGLFYIYSVSICVKRSLFSLICYSFSLSEGGCAPVSRFKKKKRNGFDWKSLGLTAITNNRRLGRQLGWENARRCHFKKKKTEKLEPVRSTNTSGDEPAG